MIKKEFKLERKSLFIWLIAMFIFLLSGMQKYTAFTGTGAEEMLKLFEEMPYFLKAMFGMSSLDVTTIVGYYGMLYFYLVLILAIHGLLLGIKIVTKDEVDKTAEFLYTKPISRRKILFNKLLVSLLITLTINIFVFITALFIIAGFSGNYLVIELILSSIASLFVQMIFLSIGMLLGIVKKNKTALYIGLGYFTFTFLLSVAIDVIEKIDFFKFLTPFKYADPKLFLNDRILDYKFIVLQLVIILIIQAVSFNKIGSKDFV